MTAVDVALLRLADVLAGVEADLGDYCGFCYAEEDAVLLAGPVDAIPRDLLSRAAFEGPDHWGDYVNLYRKLTPRIMALLVHDELHVHDELIASHLVEAGCWTTWADDERDAVLAVCRAWWSDTLASYPRTLDASVVLSFLATTSVPLTQWLDVWNAQPPGPADLHAQELFRWWWDELLNGELTVGWSGTIDITADIKRWVLTDARPRISGDPELVEFLEMVENA
ncbi:hypothetical protein [Kribbella sp. NPDC003557]|uniref:hypothetical protein n=1 Tax=Kribbella sp. NPDC003557 TaxID=3154449 RepID=UPI0033B141B0